MIQEVWGQTNISPTSNGVSLRKRIKWEGGRGWIYVNAFSTTGADEIVCELSVVDFVYSFGFPIDTFGATGVYPFEAPPGYLNFIFSLSTGETVDWDGVYVIPTERNS